MAQLRGPVTRVGCRDGHDWIDGPDISDRRMVAEGVRLVGREAVDAIEVGTVPAQRQRAGVSHRFEGVERKPWPDIAQLGPDGRVRSYRFRCPRCGMATLVRKGKLPELLDELGRGRELDQMIHRVSVGDIKYVQRMLG